MSKLIRGLAVTAPMLCLAAAASAQTFGGGARMIFSNPTGATGTLTASIANAGAPGGISTFTNGAAHVSEPTGLGNVLTVDGADAFSTTAGFEFLLADMSYYNAITLAGTAATDVEGDLEILFTMPGELVGVTRTFDFDWHFTLTPNSTGDPVLDADFLSVMTPLSPTIVTVGGVDFTLEILGFRETPLSALTDMWTLPENTSVDAGLYGRFTQVVIPLPQAAGLGLTGLALLAFPRRRR